MMQVATAMEGYVSDQERLESALSDWSPDWLAALRKSALQGFTTRGFPTTRDEEWRFTSLAPMARTPFRYAGLDAFGERLVTPEEGDLGKEEADVFDFPRLVLLNGAYAAALSSRPEAFGEIEVQSLAHWVASSPEAARKALEGFSDRTGTPFAELNTAFLHDGIVVRVPRGTVAPRPILVLHAQVGLEHEIVSHPRTLLLVEEGAGAAFVELYASRGRAPTFANAVTQVFVGANARADLVRLQVESARSFHIASTRVLQERDSRFEHFSFGMGGRIARHDLDVSLGGTNCECTLNGVYLVRGEQLIDTHTSIEHAQPHCRSWEVYKGVLDDEARAVFNGKVYVRPGAQKTDAKQTNRNLLLSPDARANSKPQLEIFADDVKCTHGATIGQIEGFQLDYCRCRGLSLERARTLLTYAFASEMVSQVRLEPVREWIDRAILAWLDA